jgi:hypothetical protein
LPEPACSEHWQLPIAMAGVNNNREWGRCPPLQHRLLLLSVVALSGNFRRKKKFYCRFRDINVSKSESF